MFEMVALAVPPAGSFQTATASTMMIATLRRCFMPSGPTAPEGTSDRCGDRLDRGLGDVAGGRVQRLRGPPGAPPPGGVGGGPARGHPPPPLAQPVHQEGEPA